MLRKVHYMEPSKLPTIPSAMVISQESSLAQNITLTSMISSFSLTNMILVTACGVSIYIKAFLLPGVKSLFKSLA